MNISKHPAIVILSFILTGCGTVVHGTHQKIEVHSIPEGATFTIFPSGQTGSTPAEVQLKRSLDHEFLFEDQDYDSQKVYVRRTQSRGASYSNAFVPYIGIIGLGIDSATGAQFNLIPSSVFVDLTEPLDEPTSGEYAEVIFFNGNKSGTVNIVFDTGEECKLKKKQYAVRELKKGAYDFEFYHWDMFKFSDEYQIKFNEKKVFLAVFSSTFGTHFAYDNQIPTEFEKACPYETVPK